MPVFYNTYFKYLHCKLSPSTIRVDLNGVPGHLSQIFTSSTTQRCHYVEPTFIQQSLWCAWIECNTIDIIRFIFLMRKSRKSLMLRVTALCVDLLYFYFINSEILSSVMSKTPCSVLSCSFLRCNRNTPIFIGY
jgi:hypothetical protein